jgi:hypothetical protein
MERTLTEAPDRRVRDVPLRTALIDASTRSPRLIEAVVGCGVVAAYLFLAMGLFGAYFPLDETKAGGPGEFVSGVSIQWFVAHSVVTYGELPLWNPFIRTGIPYIGNPYISILNPFVLVPLWAAGPINGAKIAVIIACAMAGVGQYWLGRVVGLGRLASFVGGALGLSAGSFVIPIATGFSFAGPMQHALIGAVLASFLSVMRHRSFGRIVIAALINALMFYTGFLYYWIGIGFVIGIFAIGHVWKQVAPAPTVGLLQHVLKPIVAYAFLALGLISPSLIPLVDLMPYIEKPIDVTNSGTLPFLVTVFGFVVNDRRFWANGLWGASPIGWAIYYSYIGPTILLGIPVSVVAIVRGRLRYATSFMLSTIAMLILASIHKTFFAPLLDIITFLQQFRFWGSLVAVATVLAIPLLLVGVDWLWAIAVGAAPSDGLGLPDLELRLVSTTPNGPHARRVDLSRVLLGVATVVFCVASVADPWGTNRAIVTAPTWNAAEDEVFAWVRSQSPGPLAVNANSMIYALASSSQLKYELQALDSVFPMKLRPTRVGNRNALWTAPKYALILPNAPTNSKMQLLRQFPGGWVYRLPAGLPFAFVGRDDAMPYGPEDVGARALETGTVVEAAARFDGPNRIVVTMPKAVAWAQGANPPLPRLVVMQGWMPGWRASGSAGGKRTVVPVSEYLEVADARVGETVTLEYAPTSYLVGKVFGFLALAVCILGVAVPAEVRRAVCGVLVQATRRAEGSQPKVPEETPTPTAIGGQNGGANTADVVDVGPNVSPVATVEGRVRRHPTIP